MHKIYENKGSFDFKIIYSSLISIILNIPLKYLALSNDDIIDFKQTKSNKNINKIKVNLENKLKIKFIFYFIVSILFLFFFWYYKSMFGAIYRNTQIHLIKDTLIWFGLSFFYLYKLSKILQSF